MNMKKQLNQKDEEKLESIFRKAEILWNEGKFQMAIDKYSEMLGYNDRYDLGAYTMIGGVYREINDLPNAIKCLRKATLLNPKSELPSILLFHSLMDSNKRDAAFEEARRFLAIRSSKEYDLIFDEMCEDFKE